MPKAAVRHDPQGELPHELPTAFQNSQKASSTTTAGDEHSLPLYFKNPRSNCLPNNKDPRLKRQRCLNKEPMRSLSTLNNTGETPLDSSRYQEAENTETTKDTPPKRLNTDMNSTIFAELNTFDIRQTCLPRALEKATCHKRFRSEPAKRLHQNGAQRRQTRRQQPFCNHTWAPWPV